MILSRLLLLLGCSLMMYGVVIVVLRAAHVKLRRGTFDPLLWGAALASWGAAMLGIRWLWETLI